MAIHKLEFDEFDEFDYQLVAIHTSLEDYRLAYYINQKLPTKLSLTGEEISANSKFGEAKFSRFYFFDEENRIGWNLIQNKNDVVHEQTTKVQNLFSNIEVEVSTKVYLLPEYKKVDFFLKIENLEEKISLIKIQSILNSIANVTTAYTIDSSKIKSKNNLIF